MTTAPDPAAASVDAELREWLAANWDPSLTVRQWWHRLADAGWAFPTWPVGAGGRGLGVEAVAIVNAALHDAGAVAPPGGVGTMMGGPLLIEYGSQEMRDAWLLRLAAGDEAWCQLFSEPGAGSDLASLRTTAVRDGDVWIVNGQKVWTSAGLSSTRGLLLARTNPDAPKHRGITYFVIDMDQPGIEARPLVQMNGGTSFTEVFLTDAVVHDDRRLGEVDAGWGVAVSTLAYERRAIGSRGGPLGRVIAAPGERNQALDLPIAELLAAGRELRDHPERGNESRSFEAQKRLAGDLGLTGDPIVRQRLAGLYIRTRLHQLTAERARAAAAAGRTPGPEVSIAKLTNSQTGHMIRDVAMSMLGAEGMLAGDDARDGGIHQQMALSQHVGSLAGGTDEIQRNIIGERVLGLPPDVRIDPATPFRDLPRS